MPIIRRCPRPPVALDLQANSIEGCKKKEVHVVYTRWQNLKKLPSYEVGQVMDIQYRMTTEKILAFPMSGNTIPTSRSELCEVPDPEVFVVQIFRVRGSRVVG